MLAAWLFEWQCRSVRHFSPPCKISTTIRWIKFGTHIHEPRRVKLKDFGEPLWVFTVEAELLGSKDILYMMHKELLLQNEAKHK